MASIESSMSQCLPPAPESNLLLRQTLGGSGDSPSSWALTTHHGDLEWAPSSWLWPWFLSGGMGIWGKSSCNWWLKNLSTHRGETPSYLKVEGGLFSGVLEDAGPNSFLWSSCGVKGLCVLTILSAFRASLMISALVFSLDAEGL